MTFPSNPTSGVSYLLNPLVLAPVPYKDRGTWSQLNSFDLPWPFLLGICHSRSHHQSVVMWLGRSFQIFSTKSDRDWNPPGPLLRSICNMCFRRSQYTQYALLTIQTYSLRGCMNNLNNCQGRGKYMVISISQSLAYACFFLPTKISLRCPAFSSYSKWSFNMQHYSVVWPFSLW